MPMRPPWKEYACSTQCMLGLLLHFSDHLTGDARGMSGAVLYRWLHKALPLGSLVVLP